MTPKELKAAIALQEQLEALREARDSIAGDASFPAFVNIACENDTEDEVASPFTVTKPELVDWVNQLISDREQALAAMGVKPEDPE